MSEVKQETKVAYVDNEEFCLCCGRRYTGKNMAEPGICIRCAEIDEDNEL